MTEVHQKEWDGKLHSLPQLMIDVECAYVKTDPKSDMTRIGVLDVIRKIGKQDIELSDLLTKQLADGRLKYDYGAVQRVAEDHLK